jgi:hypothetical protein
MEQFRRFRAVQFGEPTGLNREVDIAIGKKCREMLKSGETLGDYSGESLGRTPS